MLNLPYREERATVRTEIPKMTYEERQARAQAKKDIILCFLASGEVYTSVVVAAQVIAASPSATERTLIGLVRDGALKRESHVLGSRKTHIYGAGDDHHAAGGRLTLKEVAGRIILRPT